MKRLLILLIFMTGCATESQYARNMATWNDHYADELVGKWGPPTRNMILPNGNALYVYDVADQYTTAAVQFNGSSTVQDNSYGRQYYVNQTPGITVPGQTIVNWCSTFFEIDQDQKIVSVRYQGNNCTSN